MVETPDEQAPRPPVSRPPVSRRPVSRRTVLQGGLLHGAVGLAALSGLPTLSSCAASGSRHRPVPTTGAPDPLAVHLARADVPLSRVDVAPVVDGMRQFGAELYRRTATVTANCTMSPMSIDVAFGMLRAGARGTTAKQIDRVFGFPVSTTPAGSCHPVLNALTARLTSDRPVPTTSATPSPSASYTPPPAPIVAIANGLFLDRSVETQVQQAFLRVLAGQYGASPDVVSFADPAAAAGINAWVARQTRGRITKLFDQLDPGTRLVLANAVYLKAAWALPFAADQTAVGAFTTGRGQRVDAHLMRQQLSGVGYADGDGWQRVSLPYVGGELVMRIVVPTRPARDVGTLARALAAAVHNGRPDRERLVDLTLPRWTAATSLSLIRPLTQLGMPAAFGARADLSGIAPGLFVGDAVHRANITVDEKGTEAAAVTGIAIASSGMAGPVATVRADRPFAWAIVHVPTATPMFTGHVVDPTR